MPSLLRGSFHNWRIKHENNRSNRIKRLEQR